jgi:putative membrane protein
MLVFLIFALLIAIVAVIFALQNPALVTISLFAWQIHTSVAVALLVALGVGVLITILISIPGWVKRGVKNVSQKKKFSGLQAERDAFEQKIQAITAERDKVLAKLGDFEKELSNLRAKASAQPSANNTPPTSGDAASAGPSPSAQEASGNPPAGPDAEKPVE